VRAPQLPGTVARTLPTAALAAGAWGLAWQAKGSTTAADWLPYAAGGLVLALAVLLAGPLRPPRGGLAAVGALAALAAWTFVSHWWSASPSLARDEGLLTALYAVALLLPLVTLRTPVDRLVAIGLVAAAAGALAVADMVILLAGDDGAAKFVEGRLAYPISYINAQAAAFLLGWWPAVGLAAHRRVPAWGRALALGTAALVGAAALLCQSKGAELGLALSALALFAVSPGRLRLLVPTALAAGIDAALVAPLTGPYRASAAGLPGAVHDAAVATVAAGLVAAVAGLAYALVDRRVDVSARSRQLAGRIVGAAFALAAVSAIATLLLVPANPLGYLQGRWDSFKTPPASETGSSHLLSLGSYRYDTWRVAFGNWRREPVVGIGSRGFGPAYLIDRHIQRTPQHAHSLELETMSDLGFVGLVLVVAAIGIPLVRSGGGARRRLLPAAAAFGACAGWLLHSSADWLWSFPAIGVPFFALLGIGFSWGGDGRTLERRISLSAAVACAAVLVVGVLPAWIATRLVSDAQRHPASAASDLRWARRVDPLSTQVLITRAARASTYGEQLTALRTAVRMEPRQAPLYYLLGVVELNGGHRKQARADLTRALALDPRDPIVLAALASAAKP
jgi:hypothetical protein